LVSLVIGDSDSCKSSPSTRRLQFQRRPQRGRNRRPNRRPRGRRPRGRGRGRKDRPRNKRPWEKSRPRDRDRNPQGKTCEDGEQDGKRLVNSFYRGDCKNVVDRSFQSDVQRASRRKFARTRGDSWEDKIYKQCGRDAVDRELDNVGNDCLTDPIAGRDCNRFGKEVARLIVRQAGVCDKYGYRTDSIEQFQRLH